MMGSLTTQDKKKLVKSVLKKKNGSSELQCHVTTKSNQPSTRCVHSTLLFHSQALLVLGSLTSTKKQQVKRCEEISRENVMFIYIFMVEFMGILQQNDGKRSCRDFCCSPPKLVGPDLFQSVR